MAPSGRRTGRRLARTRHPATSVALLALTLLLAACGSDDRRRLRIVPQDYTGHLKTWWSDTQVKEEGDYVEGKPDGELRRWHGNGSLAFEGRFDDGVPVGEARHFHPGGTLASTETWVDGHLEGPVTAYLPDGNRTSRVVFHGGLKDGEELQWRPDGQLAVSGQWIAGLPVGRWSFWDAGGLLRRQEHYWTADGVQVGRLVTEYGPGRNPTLQELLTLHDGVWQGWRTYWHPNGRQAGLEEWRAGKREGRDLSWNPAGRLLAEGERADDAREGEWTFWDGEGHVTRRVLYAHGQEVKDLPLPEQDEAPPSG
jgi:antitoxin component YwqK of YwqJK toxin-antitoxin module